MSFFNTLLGGDGSTEEQHAGFDPNNPNTKMENGHLMVWQLAPNIEESANYLGISVEDYLARQGHTLESAKQPGSGLGEWVPASFARPDGTSPLRAIGALAATGAGGQLAANALIPGLAGGGTAAGVGGGAAAAGAGGGTAAGAGTAAAVGGGTAAGVGGGTAAGVTAGSPGFWTQLLGSVTGGKYGKLLDMGGALLSGGAGASAANRGEQANQQFNRDQLLTTQARDAANNSLQRGQLELDTQKADRESQADAYIKALRSALAMNMKDVQFSREGFRSPVSNISFNGGMRPSAIGQQGIDAATELNRQAMLRLIDGDKHTPVDDYKAPEVTPPPEAGFWEKLAGPIGLGLTTLGKLRAPGGVQDPNKPIMTGGGFYAGPATA
jgi:hypothetical protein